MESTNNSTSSSCPSRYESQKRRDWDTFGQYLRNNKPPLSFPNFNASHVLEFLNYLDQFGKTKIHIQTCPYFGEPNPPTACPCPFRQAWGSLDALVGRLRAAYDEHGGNPQINPFGAPEVRRFLREVRDFQAKSRGISYEKKRKRPKQQQQEQEDQPEQRAEDELKQSRGDEGDDDLIPDSRFQTN